MAVLSDANLAKYKSAIDALEKDVKTWQAGLSSATGVLNDSTGSTFRTQYTKGKKATDAIKNLVDILYSLNNDLTKLVSDAQQFYSKSYMASKK